MELFITFLIVLAISTAILIVAMILTSRFLGGVEFGDMRTVALKSAGLLIVVTAVNVFLPFGIFVSLAIWFFGLMYLFNLDVIQTIVLVAINWGIYMLLSAVLHVV